jgi:invasion protein IalB
LKKENAKGVLMDMTRFASRSLFAGTLAAVFTFAGTISSVYAQQQQPPTNGWYKVCSKQEETDICNVSFQAVASTGQLLTAVSLLEIRGKENLKKLQVTVPPSRAIPPGINVKVDDKSEVKMPYIYCFPQRCIAAIDYDDTVISLLKSGGEMLVTSTNYQNKANPIKVTLNGFTAAYDGEPLKQDELEARQRKLQEELQAKAEEQRRKLQEEQEKAKQGTN